MYVYVMCTHTHTLTYILCPLTSQVNKKIFCSFNQKDRVTLSQMNVVPLFCHRGSQRETKM